VYPLESFCDDFKKPNLVLSGINWGDNTGLYTLYGSGTIAACVEATLYNIPAIAFSLYQKNHKWRERNKQWPKADAVINTIVPIIKKLIPSFEKDLFFSVNLPNKLNNNNIVIAEPQRIRFEVKIEKRLDPDGRPYYWFTGPAAPKEKGKDFDLLVSNNIVITPIKINPIAHSKFNDLNKLFK